MVIKLTDFGIAKLLDAQGVTSTGQVLGSPAHMAPEQIEGRDVDARADVFALGVLLYECMVGHLPFMGTNPAQVLRRVLDGEYPSAERELATVGKTWSHLLDRALASNVADRYANAGEMRDALTGELARMGVAAPRAEIERWLDDPERFVLEHKTAMTTRLCDRAAEAQKRGDVLTAASDYNRALAYSPDDPALLKLVLRVNRRRARAEVVRRMLPLGSVAILLAVGGLAVARALLSRTPPPPVTPDTDALGAVTKPVVVLPPPAVVPSDLLSEAPSATRVLARPTVSSGRAAPPPPPHETSREVRFSSVVPAEGVSLSIDGAPPTPLDVQKPLTLDEKRHALTFTCRFDLCDPLVRAVDPGDRPATLLPVHLTIKPGFLKVIGQPGMHYFLDGDPAHPLNANGEANLVAMTQSAVRFVRVKELETQQTRTIDVRAKQTAGPLDFNQPP
jgi:serine/threonine-protein kinase